MTTAVSRPSSPLCCCPDEDQVHSDSLRDPETFWARQAERLHWHKFPEAALRVVDGAHLDDRDTSGTVKDVEETHVVDHRPDACITWTWFPGGEISTCYNCVDRHVLAGNGSQVAIYYDSPVTGTKATFTYVQLLEEVEALAGALREEGVRRGDVVLVYSKWKRVRQRIHSPKPIISFRSRSRTGGPKKEKEKKMQHVMPLTRLGT